MKYVHHIPGRMRVRTERLRNNEGAAAQFRTRLARLEGIRSAEVNPVTGSALIHYDVEAANLTELLDALRELGSVDGKLVTAQRRNTADPDLGPAVGKAVAKTVGAYLLQTALERSVVALVSALI